MVDLQISVSDIIIQNQIVTSLLLLIGIFQITSIFKFQPMNICIFGHYISLIVIMAAPFLLVYFPSKLSIFIMQMSGLAFASLSPAQPIFYNKFTIFKRTTTILFTVSMASATVAALWIPIRLMLKNIGPFFLYAFLVPLMIVSLIGKYYFKNLDENQK